MVKMLKMTMWTGPRHNLNTMSPLAEQNRTGSSPSLGGMLRASPQPSFTRDRETETPTSHDAVQPGQPIGQTKIAAAEMGKRRVRRYYGAEHLVLTTDAGEQSRFFLVGRQKSRSVDGVELAATSDVG